jgi:cytochrome c biogenesis protein
MSEGAKVHPRKTETQSLWGRLASLRLTLALFLILAGASILGTLIPQNRPFQEYLEIYGSVATRIFKWAGLTDVYHSLWFMGILGLLVVHLVACSLQRLPATWKSLRTPQRPLSDGLLKSLPVVKRFELEAGVEEVVEALRGSAPRFFSRFKQEKIGETLHLLSQRGRWSRMGAYVAHMGVLGVLVGATIGFAFGFKGFVQIPEGKSVELVEERGSGKMVPLGFQVKCERFHVSSYPDGTPREYRSDLVFMKDGRRELEGALRVNHPISFGGYQFYQASYGISARVTFEAQKDSAGPPLKIIMEPGDTSAIDPQGQIVVRFLRYETDLQGRGPAVLLAHLRQDGHPVAGWVFQRDGKATIGGWSLKISHVEEHRWTGIQVKRDPGVWIVWVGCGLIMVGCAMAFLGVHRRIWIKLEPGKDGTHCWIAASSNRDIEGTKRQVEMLAEEFVKKGVRKSRG